MDSFSDWIIYADESGDHGMASVDPQSPMFVLAFCLFRKNTYAERICPALRRFKFNYFGHDMVVLHERDIRKKIGPFAILCDATINHRFHADLSDVISTADFTLVACAIDKTRLGTDQRHANPYHIALVRSLEQVMSILHHHGQENRRTHVIFEARGKREDQELELEFRRICDGDNRHRHVLPLDFVAAHKQTNAAGLQFADLVARPLAQHVLHPEQPNRAWDIIATKLNAITNHQPNLICLPQNERPR